jgi:hopene-associated glycosyltransferase HpnB
MILTTLVLMGLVLWLAVLLLPWRPWSTRERLEALESSVSVDLSDVTVLIPARNEADTIGRSLEALNAQGAGLQIIVVDDQSTDGTSELAMRATGGRCRIVRGRPLPSGWTGKLWALEQGRPLIETPLTLLMDADIVIRPGMVATLKENLKGKGLNLISLMAALQMEHLWERSMMPAFIYFFKLLYPFSLSNNRASRVAAAAGGCILLETRILNQMGGFKALSGELIDDCALARSVKEMRYKTWIGLTRSVQSLRRYRELREIWNMVARTAFTQLRTSGVWLMVCTLILLLAFGIPLWALAFGDLVTRILAMTALCFMILGYIPTLRFYGLSPLWALSLPFVGILYLSMTWTSAVCHWQGKGSQWKDRHYGSQTGER